MSSKYNDITAVMQVIGCVFNNPTLLDYTEKYSINEEDFDDMFHRTVFGAIYTIYEMGGEKINLRNISDFFETRPKSKAIFENQKGEEWLAGHSSFLVCPLRKNAAGLCRHGVAPTGRHCPKGDKK